RYSTFSAFRFRQNSREHRCSIHSPECRCSSPITLWAGSDYMTHATSTFSRSTPAARSCMTSVKILTRRAIAPAGKLTTCPLIDRDWNNGSPPSDELRDHRQGQCIRRLVESVLPTLKAEHRNNRRRREHEGTKNTIQFLLR